MDKVVKLKPVVKSYLWGGTYFQKYGKGNQDIISELWELSVREDDSSFVDETNQRLIDVITKEDLGPNCLRFPYFPILIKLIDAKDDLSIQVHPSDEYALKNEHSFGKSEMWYVLDASKNAKLVYGFRADMTKERIRKSIERNSINKYLQKVKIHKGDVFYIEAGTVHAIGAGALIAEIQENSNITYRMYDYDRVDKNGCKRELHIDKAKAEMTTTNESENKAKITEAIITTIAELCNLSQVGQVTFLVNSA